MFVAENVTSNFCNMDKFLLLWRDIIGYRLLIILESKKGQLVIDNLFRKLAAAQKKINGMRFHNYLLNISVTKLLR